MSANSFYKVIVLFCAFCLHGFSQENSVLTLINKSNSGVVKIKWYSQKLVYPEGVNIYHKEVLATSWKKINCPPIKKDDYKPTSLKLQKDQKLESHTDMVNSVIKREGLAMLGAEAY